jgi:hypothetical protein
MYRSWLCRVLKIIKNFYRVTTMSVISKYLKDTDIFVFDNNEDKIKQLNSNNLTFFEP